MEKTDIMTPAIHEGAINLFLPISRKEIKKKYKKETVKEDHERGTERGFKFQDGEEEVRIRQETEKMTQFR